MKKNHFNSNVLFSKLWFYLWFYLISFSSIQTTTPELQSKMALTNTLIFALLGAIFLGASLVLAEGECIKGEYHKPAPEAVKSFQICQEFSNNTCCTKEFTDKLKVSRTEDLYNHTWDLCKPLSKQCEKFWLQQVMAFISFLYKS